VAVVRVGNKIYVGFEPSRSTLANLIMMQIVEKVIPKITVVQAVAIGVTTALVVYVTLKNALLKILSRIFDLISFLVICIGGYLNLQDKDVVLLNDLRRNIYNYILENPGVHLREIRRKFDISLSTAMWHLKILEKAGLIKSEKFGNKLIYYPTGMNKEDLLIMLTLNNETAKRIINYIAKVGEAHIRKIVNDLAMNIETVRYHLRRLERAGVLLSKEIGNKIVYTLNPELFVRDSKLKFD
jgi:predicted transcriptional regulator